MLLDDEKLKEAFEGAVQQSESAVKLLIHFIEHSGCFRTGLAQDDRQELYNRGYGDFGLYIRDLFLEYAPEEYKKNIKRSI